LVAAAIAIASIGCADLHSAEVILDYVTGAFISCGHTE